MLSRGDRVGRYIVESQIAVGGMASTYLCMLDGHAGFEKRVVVKIMREEHRSDERYLEMFLDEARLSARLAHPSIPQVFELGDHGGLPFMVMEHVDGPSLYRISRQIKKKKIERPLGWSIHAFHQVAGALEYAGFGTDPSGQPLNTVHRDVSLPNILVTPGGHAKLIDFGIAKTEAQLHETEIGTLKGSIQFMSPEQLRGERELDPRSDIFSLGVCLFIAITGRSPYPGEDPVTLWNNRLEGVHVPLRDLRPDCLVVLAQIVDKAMALSPDDRYQRPAQLGADLERLLLERPDMAWGPARLSSWLEDLFPDGEQSWRPPVGQPTTAHTPMGVSGITPLTPTTGPHPGIATMTPPHASTYTPATPMAAYPPLADLTAQRRSDRVLVPAVITLVLVVLALIAVVFVGIGWVASREVSGPPATASVTAAPVAAPTMLTLESEPAGAEVWEGDDRIGTTPLTVPLGLADADPPRAFLLVASGYEPLEIRQPWSTADVVRYVQLVRALAPEDRQAAAAPAARPAPKPKPVPKLQPTPKKGRPAAPTIHTER